jgi:hypothetical protein
VSGSGIEEVAYAKQFVMPVHELERWNRTRDATERIEVLAAARVAEQHPWRLTYQGGESVGFPEAPERSVRSLPDENQRAKPRVTDVRNVERYPRSLISRHRL